MQHGGCNTPSQLGLHQGETGKASQSNLGTKWLSTASTLLWARGSSKCREKTATSSGRAISQALDPRARSQALPPPRSLLPAHEGQQRCQPRGAACVTAPARSQGRLQINTCQQSRAELFRGRLPNKLTGKRQSEGSGGSLGHRSQAVPLCWLLWGREHTWGLAGVGSLLGSRGKERDAVGQSITRAAAGPVSPCSGSTRCLEGFKQPSQPLLLQRSSQQLSSPCLQPASLPSTFPLTCGRSIPLALGDPLVLTISSRSSLMHCLVVWHLGHGPSRC